MLEPDLEASLLLLWVSYTDLAVLAVVVGEAGLAFSILLSGQLHLL